MLLPLLARARRRVHSISFPAAAILLLAAISPARALDPEAPRRAVSPDGRIAFEFLLDDGGRPAWRVLHDRTVIVEKSKLGFVLKDAQPFTENLRVIDARIRDDVEEWDQPWGEVRHIRSAYAELTVDLEETSAQGRRMSVIVRVFNDGLGFRFTWPEQENLGDFVIMDELTEFTFPGDPVAWWIPGYGDNRYEYLYQRSRLSALTADTLLRSVNTPLTLETEGGRTVSIHEANLTDYASMTLAVRPGSVLAADLIPWSDGARVKARTPFQTPWRTIQIADTPGDLITSTLLLCLNEPSKIADTSWIRPMKYAGIWWSLHVGLETWHPGPTHGATTEKTERMIDFAAENGLGGVLVEGWNTGWDRPWLSEPAFDWTTPMADYDLEALAAYAKEKGVTLIGHLETGGDVDGFERRMEAAFAQCERLGITAVKTGYVNHGQNIRRYDEARNVIAREWQHGQYMVRHFQKAVETAARYHVSLDVHEPIKDTGLRRTWPNMMTREGARGTEYDAWSEGNPPEHTAILPFTRLLSGPMDFTPGIFDVEIAAKKENRVHTTIAKQLALFVVIYSPLQMVTDLPENYRGNPAFGFIQSVPVDWEETRVLNGAIGDYVTIARRERGGRDWFLGSLTNAEPRTFSVPLDFLEPGVDYTASIYADGAGADWKQNPTAMSITRRKVNSETRLRIDLAPGGGTAIRIQPMER